MTEELILKNTFLSIQTYSMKNLIRLLICLAALNVTMPANAQEAALVQLSTLSHTVKGLVVHVVDGDTVDLLIDSRPVRVRLAQIDAPEMGQPFGNRSKESLIELVKEKEVVATWEVLDKYQRPIVNLSCDGININQEQVRRGMAWVYIKYAKDEKLFSLEMAARKDLIGLWSDHNVLEPWLWREYYKPQKK